MRAENGVERKKKIQNEDRWQREQKTAFLEGESGDRWEEPEDEEDDILDGREFEEAAAEEISGKKKACCREKSNPLVY